jgi:phage terminase large subunit GpA-like protein
MAMIKKNLQPRYRNLTEVIHDLSEILKPPERLSISTAAERYRHLNNPGSYVGPWMNSTAPYLTEAMDALGDRAYNAVIFAGPAQAGKTELILNWITASIMSDPADFLLVEKSQAAARDFSRRRLDRLHRHSPETGNKMIKRRDSDNTFDKLYRSGMMLTLSWPAINELSGRPIPRVALTDYDRMPENIDGEGSPFDLARKRTTTFRTFAKTLAESSPGYSIEDLRWMPRTPNEAPPCPGILALYNRGDRRRWLWPCPHCHEYFEGDFDLLTWVDSDDLLESAESAKMRCPHCSALIEHGQKYDMNQLGLWVRDGQKVTREREITGTPYRSDVASFWLKGVAAAFATWKTLVLNYVKAEQEYERTGSDEALKSTVNTDQGKPYLPRGMENTRLPEEMKARAEPVPEKVVPEGVRFLIATADVQKNKWVVQVFGIGVGADMWVIDRFDILKSKRTDAEGDRLWVKPAAYIEDWDLLLEEVALKSYPIDDGSGRHMPIKLTACDSGGRSGVTNNAYTFWKKLRDSGTGMHKRLLLLKGDAKPGAPRVRVSYPDSGNNKGRTAGARGEVPVLMMNVNVLKDRLNAMLDRKEPGGGEIHFPDWLPDEFFTEMCVERRTPKGWENPRSYRNEAWDLFTYGIGLTVHLRAEHIDWSDPPGWAAEWDSNDLLFVPTPDKPTSFAAVERKTPTLQELAAMLG